MKNFRVKNVVLASILATFVVGCGSGSSDGGTTPPTPTPTPAKIFGTVDSISPTNQTITVNGRTLATASAMVTYQQDTLTTDAITKGMQVEILTANNSAKAIALDPAITGTVSAIDQDTITVNGLAFTYPQAQRSNDITVGSWVMISAKLQNDGSWLASSITSPAGVATQESEIEGRISQLNEVAQQFNIGTLVVNYSNAELDLEGQQLANGQWVEVEGRYDSQDLTLFAQEVDIENDMDFNDAEIEGTVTWVNTEKTLFEIDSRTRILVTPTTQFEDGKLIDLNTGRHISVDLITKGTGLEATEIEFEDASGSIPQPFAREFTVEGLAQVTNGAFSINGIEFTLDAGTYYDDGLTVGTLNNTWVEVEGIEVEAATLTPAHWLVKEIEPELRETNISLEGLVSNNSLWNYPSSDNSLARFNDKWVEVECQLNGDDLLKCRLDD
ncbi:DUF5666 domain-containing protein [Shewanella sp. D64]|uniref:DUF5666 domain-containing protein n=1 Tax=unclassified Shewanella TaxID=196818 RepID=UPI0022BA673F|nr:MULTISPECIES: DUF5666 domain-containing protein [unclassified Shewanella]MEC4728675.1 DUF5666 domain-containing protein [Shewanella sp. D64]MEC4736544.1 DUF5666 domain-containing protein [Shewanella sp. E94]WBJ97404.1 DUF5666 domain-containing protein [Shewanella sp. MTB7]